MDTLTTLITAVCSLLGALGGGSLLYLRQTRKMKEVEVESRQSEEWKRLYETSEAERKELGAKLDKLYDERKELLGQVLDRDRQLARKDIELTSLGFARCYVNHCRRRKPPRKYEFEIEPEINFENETNETNENDTLPPACPAAAPAAGIVQDNQGAAPVGPEDRTGDGNPA